MDIAFLLGKMYNHENSKIHTPYISITNMGNNMDKQTERIIFGELIKKVREWEKNEGYTDYYEKDEDSGLEIISIKNSTTIYTYFNELPVSAIDEINEITKKVNWEIEKITATGDGLLCFVLERVK